MMMWVFSTFHLDFSKQESKKSVTQIRNGSSLLVGTSKRIGLKIYRSLDIMTLCVPGTIQPHTFIPHVTSVRILDIEDYTVFLHTHLKCYLPVYSIEIGNWSR